MRGCFFCTLVLVVFALTACMLGAFQSSGRSRLPSEVVVTAGSRDVPEVPVAVVLPEGASGNFVLKREPDGAVVPCQIERQDNRLHVIWIIPGLKAGESIKYRLVPQRGTPRPNAVLVRRVGDDAEIQVNGKLFTRYVTRGANKPYFYPLVGPTGVPITRHYPMREVESETRDHPHHRSFWFTH
ncbi:MAG: DUF6807 family protein, partial [Armatimonadota bacterium]